METTTHSYQSKMDAAIDSAVQAFYGDLARQFPECEFGDVEPGMDAPFQDAAAEMTRHWYTSNLMGTARKYGIDFDPDNFDPVALADEVRARQSK